MKSIWNVFDILSLILIPLIIILDLKDVDERYVRPLNALCLFIFYIRLFYFLMIFDGTSHLVKTIVQISYDIRYFILILAIGSVAFGSSFFVLSHNTEKQEDRFIGSFFEGIVYSYQISFGDFHIDSFD